MFIFDRDKHILYCFSTLCQNITSTSTMETLLFLPSVSAVYPSLHLKFSTWNTSQRHTFTIHFLFSIDEMQIWVEERKKRYPRLKCFTWSEAVVWQKSKWCECVRASVCIYHTNEKKYFYLHFSRALTRSRLLKRDDK